MDCSDGLKQLDDNSIDLMVSDPPYALVSGSYNDNKRSSGGFMGKKWDAQLPPIEIWQESLRVLKPGAFAFIMCAPRTDVQWRMSSRLEEAGFNVNYSPIIWTFASGFPKALNIKKKILKDIEKLMKEKYGLDDIEWED